MNDETPGKRRSPLRWLWALLTGDTTRVVGEVLELLFVVGQRFNWYRPEGIYRVLDHDATLELTDRGQRAVLHRRKHVRFLQDNVVAFWDAAWGDGDLFAEYACSPGVPVDRFKEGAVWYTVISLREIKRRGDTLHFAMRRVIRDGFTRAEESWETEVQHPTQRLRIAVVFPADRPCRGATVVQKNERKTERLGTERFRTLGDGRQLLEWEALYPRLHDRYLVKWSW